MVGEIGSGLMILVAVRTDDTGADVEAMADKLLGLRIFRDTDGKMNRSIQETGGSMLLVSQFTLYGDVRRGRRPAFVDAASPDLAEPLFDRLVKRVADGGVAVSTGVFGAMMEVALVNDGPVTLVIEVAGGKVV